MSQARTTPMGSHPRNTTDFYKRMNPLGSVACQNGFQKLNKSQKMTPWFLLQTAQLAKKIITKTTKS
jgi:hypothetical protein